MSTVNLCLSDNVKQKKNRKKPEITMDHYESRAEVFLLEAGDELHIRNIIVDCFKLRPCTEKRFQRV